MNIKKIIRDEIKNDVNYIKNIFIWLNKEHTLKEWMEKTIPILVLLMIIFIATSQTVECEAMILYKPNIINDVKITYNDIQNIYRIDYGKNYIIIEPFFENNLGVIQPVNDILSELKTDSLFIYNSITERKEDKIIWGFIMNEIPKSFSDKMNYMGYRIKDTNINKNDMEIDFNSYLNVSVIRFKQGFTIDYSDLLKKYKIKEFNTEYIKTESIKGLKFINADPITYSSNTIQLTSGIYSFKDIYDADILNGWGVVKNNNNGNVQYEINSRIQIGDGTLINKADLVDTNKEIVFIYQPVSGLKMIEIEDYSSLQLGSMTDEGLKVTKNGCAIIYNKISTGTWYPIDLDGYNAYYKLYSSMIKSIGERPYAYIHETNNLCKSYNNIYIGIGNYASSTGGNYFNNYMTNCYMGWLEPDISEIINNIEICDMRFAIYVSGTGYATLENCRILKNMYMFLGTGFNGNLTMIDCYVDDYNIYWGSSTDNAIIKREYTFNLKVKDEDGAPIQNAIVNLKRNNGLNEFTENTTATGYINEKIVYMGYYKKSTGNTLISYSPFNLTISKTGYSDYKMNNLIIDEPTNLKISLVTVNATTDNSWFMLLIFICVPLLIVLAIVLMKERR